MAAYIVKESSVFIDGYDLSCAFKELGITKSAGEIDTTAVCTTGDRTFVAGLKEGTATLNGIYDYDATDEDALENVLAPAFDAQEELILTTSFNALIVGGEAWMLRGGQTENSVENQLEQLIMTNATIRANGNAFRGVCLFKAAVDDTTTAGSSVDNAAATANGGMMHFHVHTPDVDITDAEVLLEHSTDNSSWVTLIAATPLGAGFGAVAVEVAAGTTVRRYLRATVTTEDGSATAVVAFHRYV